MVVSPLVSLIVDLVSSLHSCGISDAIRSGNSGVDKKYLASRQQGWPVYRCHRCLSEVETAGKPPFFVCIFSV